ncbi:hypothetical protein QR680_002486 [Steinernema hermaphroditum]|uniref:lysozyme n=1 Tax=Steinernema hermaphroditum TaxID=289476 RepID=A0AA39H4N8_9BILA|nr:hypothetical protein QR680_002486 [Steinernema hermaphroditum]
MVSCSGAPSWTMYALIVLVQLAALAAPSKSFLLFPQVEFDNECLRAMCVVDSGCQSKGCSNDANGRLGCGYFRLNMYQYKQCYQPGKQIDEDSETAWLRCAEDYECSSQCIKTLGNLFRLKCYGKSDCETLARIHDGGASGCRHGETLPYWLAVRAECIGCP